MEGWTIPSGALFHLGSSVSAIPFTLYQEIMHEIQPCEIEDIDVTIHLANKQTISPVGIVRDVEVLCGKVKYATDFLVLGQCKIVFALLSLVGPSSALAEL